MQTNVSLLEANFIKKSALHRREVIKCVLEFFEPTELVKLQLTCKHWYEVKIPIALPVAFTEFGVTQRKLVELLESEPVNLKAANLALWKKMKRFKPEEQLRYWAILDPNLQPFDFSEAVYDEWDWQPPGYDEPMKCWGTRHKKSKQPHGVVRSMLSDGTNFSEGTWLDGKPHGLIRMLNLKGQQAQILVYFYKNKRQLAYMHFTDAFEKADW